MDPISTSIFAKAKTSAEADKLERMSLTALLAPEAVRTPKVPTMKYDMVLVRPSPVPLSRYAEKSGTPVDPTVLSASSVAVWLAPPEGRTDGPAMGALARKEGEVENRRD